MQWSYQRQKQQTASSGEWFSEWKTKHNGEVKRGEKIKFNFVAPETWKCIQILLLSHDVMIQLFCIYEKYEIIRVQ